MAKITFNKLGLVPNNSIITIIKNDVAIDVKQYLPINDKLELISRVVNSAISNNQNNFANPPMIEVLLELEIVFAYCNINFSKKQITEDLLKTYDLLKSNGLIKQILNAIPGSEVAFLRESTQSTISEFYKQQNSVMGILENISKDYEGLKLDTEEITKNLKDEENLSLLKNILTKMG